MNNTRPAGRRAALTLALALVVARSATPAFSQTDKKLGWAGEAGLSLVATSGNSEGQTLGLSGKGTYTGARDAWTVEAAGLRTETTRTTFLGIARPDGGFDIRQIDDKSVTAENYALRGRYDREITSSYFWFAGAGWERNTFAGFDARYQGVAGVGRKWLDGESTKFRTDLGLTYTSQKNVIGSTDEFAGVRFSWDFSRKLGSSTTFANVLALDTNFDESADYRVDTLSTLGVAMSDRLAIQIGLRLLYDHQPGFERVEVTGLPTRRFFVRELADLDSIFTTALVYKF
ncbi:MAG TPA: DUF481 domain-containing protein [Thermoanaerobaculia bacterium]|nr:DUF481 domain-containing protein [Thermoanaerobaculia bacterium]